MYKKIYEQGKGENKHLIHLWDDDGYRQINWNNYAYRECREEDAKYKAILSKAGGDPDNFSEADQA